MMYSQHHAPMAPPQKPETFMLSSEAQQSLPQDAQVALQQVDNCELPLEIKLFSINRNC
jgi:transcription factor STE12